MEGRIMKHRIVSVVAFVALVAALAAGVAVLVALATSTAGVVQAQGADPAGVALQAAKNKQQVEGKLDEAITLYREVIAKYSQNRPVAARALVALGQCFEQLGAAQTSEARKAYEQAIRDFGDQADAVATAKARLAVLSAAYPAVPAAPPGSLRRVYEGTMWPNQQDLTRVSDDGRFVLFGGPGEDRWTLRELATGKESSVRYPSPGDSVSEFQGRPAEPIRAWPFLPLLSPDHMQIVYCVILQGAERNARRQFLLRIVGVDGSGARLVWKPDQPQVVRPVRWAPDGKSVVVYSEVYADHTYAFLSIRLSDGAVTPLSVSVPSAEDDVAASLSPDGRVAVVTEWTKADGYGYNVVNPRTGQRTRVTNPARTQHCCVIGWAPDSSGFVISNEDQQGALGLWLVRVANGAPQTPPQLLRRLDKDAEPMGVGTEGHFYYSKRTPVSSRYVVALDPATGKAIGTPMPRRDLQIACGFDWSPDGATIATGARLNQSGVGGTSEPCTVIAIRSLTDGRERILSPGLAELKRPRWSPDGKSVMVFGRRDNTYGVFIVDVETNSARLLAESPKPGSSLGDRFLIGDWTPDGRGVYLGRFSLASGDDPMMSRLVYRDLASGVETERYSIKNPGMIFNSTIAVSRDGDVAMLVSEIDGSRAAVVVPADGGPARTVYRVPASRAFSLVAWAADGKAVYVPERVPGEARQDIRKLVRVPIAGGEPTDAGLSFPAMDGTQPSPDGKRLAFVANEQVLEIWAIDRIVPTRAGAPVAARK
jgi:Tol biopolymer transport system component